MALPNFATLRKHADGCGNLRKPDSQKHGKSLAELDFHSCNTGSNPVGVTQNRHSLALMGRGFAGIWKRAGRPNWYAWIDGKQVNLGTANEKDAKRLWHRISGTPEKIRPASGQFVVTLLNAFLRHLKDDGRKDLGWYRSRVKSFADSIPKRLLLSELRPQHVTEWMRANVAWSPTHKAGSISAVQRALNWHAEEGTIKRNPLAKLRKPKRTRREFVYSPDQLKALLAAMDEPARTFIEYVAATGCRPSELAAANGVDVAGDGATISVRKTKTQLNGPMPVPERLRDRLIELSGKAGQLPLFATRTGSRWNRTTWGRAMTAARVKAELPADADVYALRHTWATERLKEGWGVADVALAMRTSVAMISRVYSHLLGERTRGLADRLS